MVPQIWVTLDNLPLTPNGKVDKSALPAPDMDKLMEGQYAAPRNLTEEKLVQIWEQLLEIEQVGIYDNFFQLGGHSLLAIRLISAVRKEFNAEMPIDYIFDNPTIATLAPKLVVKPKSELLPALVKQQHFGKIPLSFSQERLWFIDQLEGSVQYHIPEILEIKGDLNVDALISSLHLIVKKHQVLRTIIIQDKADAYQEVLDVKDWKVDVLDIRNLPNAKDRLDETIFSFINSPFNLSKDFVFRAKLIHVSDDLYKLAIVVHHIAFDGWSISVIVRDLVNFYSALVKGQQPEFSSDEVQYADFALWQRKYLTRDILDKKLQYWTKKLEGITPLELPTDFARPAIQNSEGALYDFKLEQELVAGLERINRETGTTLFMVLLAAYKVFLYRYTSQEDLSVGTAVAGRQQKALEQMVGFFVNTLVIRSIVNPNQTFSAFLEEVKRNTLEAFENQELPFEKLVETVVKERDLSRTPLFQTMLVLQNTPEMPELKLGKAKITSDDFEISTSKFDFSMELMPTQNGSLNGRVEYSTEVFELNTIQTMTRHFINILHALVNNTNQKVGKLNMLDDKEIKQAISEFKPEIIPVLPEQTIVNLFEKQVVNTPNAVALELAGAEMTYQNLNTLSNRVSNFILQKGLKADQLVGICMQRSLEMVVAMMGVLKSGAAYVPVDDNYPDDRIGEIIEDTGATIILSDTSNKSRLTALSNSLVVDIQELISDNSGLPAENPSLKIDEKSLAYVMYTSGSTGKPKGVMIERKSMMSYVFRYAEFCNLQPEDCVLQHTTLSFDTSVEEIFPALITGASVAIVKEGGKDIPYIIDYIEKGKVTIISSTPLMVEAINNDLNSIGKLRFLICGGDVLNPSAIDKLFGKVKIGNGYGPTETTVAITLYETAGISDASSIGGPLPNTHVYIMDKNENPLPARIPGEIWIGGVQIARGYLNQRELTDSKFVKDPFINDDQARVYKTGDLARFKKDGTLEFLGRIDEQLKIRGYRVEPEEIENAIVQSKLVSQCVVIGKRDNDGINRLIAYVVAPNEFDQLAIMRFLKLHLPEYMVPQIWVKLDALPINTNGKIDKKLLPEPDISKLLESTYVAPVDDIEKQLVEIWKTQLGIEKIGTNDNFFQIGGHSILATKVVSQINNTFSINLPIRSIFEFTTIKELAAYIKLLILPTQNVSKSESFTL
jgi:amino acid adenylation domain-containing protein